MFSGRRSLLCRRPQQVNGMRIAIASGKGGAGKTTVAVSLASVWDRPCVVADTDVEAPNVHLFLSPKVDETLPVFLEIPEIETERCTSCGACRDLCRYKAIAMFGKKISLFSDLCHGCGGCFLVCPTHALSSGKRLLGHLETGSVPGKKHAFIMGRARIGEAMTPPQLRVLQKKLEETLEAKDASGEKIYADALLDAPPGVSCPAMTVARDADLILLVAEPTPFGFHDFVLACEAFAPLNKPMAVVVNRAKMPGNEEGDREMLAYCTDRGFPVLAMLPFSREAAEHYASGQVLASHSPAWSERFISLRDAVRKFAGKEGNHA